MKKIAILLFVILSACAALLRAQVSEPEGINHSICEGGGVTVSAMFRYPASIVGSIVGVRGDDTGEVFMPDEFDRQAKPANTATYKLVYYKPGESVTSEVASVITVQHHPVIKITGTAEGEYCKNTTVSVSAGTKENVTGDIAWATSTGDFTGTGDNCSFPLQNDCYLYAIASNELCGSVRDSVKYTVTPQLTFAGENPVVLDNLRYKTCSSCKVALPPYTDFIKVVTEGTVTSGSVEWADGTSGEKPLTDEEVNLLFCKVNLHVEKSNACQTVSKDLVLTGNIVVESYDCNAALYNVGAKYNVTPCAEGYAEVRANRDTTLMKGFTNTNIGITPSTAFNIRETNSLVSISSGKCNNHRWYYYPSTEPAEDLVNFTATMNCRFTRVCRYSNIEKTQIKDTSFIRTFTWNNEAVKVEYSYCDGDKANLVITILSSGLQIDEITFNTPSSPGAFENMPGKDPDGLYERYFVSARPLNSTNSVDMTEYGNIDFHIKLSGTCNYEKNISSPLVKKACEPVITYTKTVNCIGDSGSVKITPGREGQVIDSAVAESSLFKLYYNTVLPTGGGPAYFHYRPYFALTDETQSLSGTIKITGYVHDRDNPEVKYTPYVAIIHNIRTCPPTVEVDLNPAFAAECDSCPGSRFRLSMYATNPSLDFNKTKFIWNTPTGKLLRNERNNRVNGSIPNILQEYAFYNEPNLQLSLQYNEGDTVRTMPVALPARKINAYAKCKPRIEVSKEFCCAGDQIEWFVYMDYKGYNLESGTWSGGSSPVTAAVPEAENYIYTVYPEDKRHRLHYSTTAQAPGIYPYTVRYAVNDTVLTYSDTLRISVLASPHVFTLDTLYACMGQTLDLSPYVDNDIITNIINAGSDPGSTSLTVSGLTVNRKFPVVAQMKYNCDNGGTLVEDEVFIAVEDVVYVDIDQSPQLKCMGDTVALIASTNGRIMWTRQKYTDGGTWGQPDTLYGWGANKNLKTAVNAEKLRYNVYAFTQCNPASITTLNFEVSIYPDMPVVFKDTAGCYPSEVTPGATFPDASLQPDMTTAVWRIGTDNYTAWPTVNPGLDTLVLAFEVNSANGCRVKRQTLLFNHRLPEISTEQGDSVCAHRYASTPLVLTGADTYRWRDNQTNPSFKNLPGSRLDYIAFNDGEIYVEGTENATGCRHTDTLTVTLHADMPPIGDTTVCVNQPVDIEPEVDPEGTVYYDWWFKGAPVFHNGLLISRVTGDDTGTYTVHVHRGDCQYDYTHRISVYAVADGMLYTEQAAVCSENDFTLAFPNNASALGFAPQYSWTLPDGSITPFSADSVLVIPQIREDQKGVYGVEMQYENCKLSDAVLIYVKPTPRPAFGNDTFFCHNTQITLNAAHYKYPGTLYKWSTGQIDSSVIITRAGDYWVELLFSGCENRYPVKVAELPVPVLPIEHEIQACRYQEYTLAPGEEYAPYTWYYLHNNTVIGYDEEITLEDTATVFIGVKYFDRGCPGCDTVTVERGFCGDIYFANAFTPNGDGFNDTYGPVTLARGGDIIYQMYIFNSSGVCVFKTQNIQDKWDGNYKGKPAPAGVYTVKCRIINRYNNEDLSTVKILHLIR